MKITTLLIFSTLLTLSANEMSSQQDRATLNLRDVLIERFIDEIEKNTDFKFVYKVKDVNLERRISITTNDELVSSILAKVFNGSDTRFTILDNQVYLTRKIPPVNANQKIQRTATKNEVQFSISGTVVDGQGVPLPGANIIEKGTTNGTQSDFDGNFALSLANGNATLVVSYIGFETKEMAVSGQSTLTIELNQSSSALDEVVVVGYGTQVKSDVTGAVASIPDERLESLPNNNILQALQGSVAGLNVSQTSASAEGSDFNLIIRGSNSILANNQPLIVLDGVPYSGSFSDINPVDIKSVEVLKDASSSAIYGSRGSNGVILITTKRGEAGKLNINYDSFIAINSLTNVPELLNGEEFFAFKEERSPGFISPTEQSAFDNGITTDWVDVASRNAFKTQHTLSVNGGSEKSNYYISTSYLDSEGITLGDDFERISLRFNLNADITSFIKFGTNTQLNRSDRSGLGPEFNGEFASQADPFRMNPLIQPFDENDDQLLFPWEEEPRFGNPLQNLLASDDDVTNKIFTNNFIEFGLNFIPGLTYRINTGIEHENRKADTYFGTNTATGVLAPNGRLNSINSVRENYLIENILDYIRTFGNHKIGFTGLYSYQEEKFDERRLFATNFPSDVLEFYQPDQALEVVPTANFRRSILLSQMARLNYSFLDRYLITLTGRRDAFSGFGPNNKYSFFPSIALGWKISDENFLKDSNAINFLKFRLSYGENGNQAIQPYQSKSRLESLSYVENGNLAPGFSPSQLANADLGWETTTSLNIGLDYSLFSQRVRGSIDYYRNNTEDLLLNRTIPSTNGVTSITQNIGEVENNGIELVLNTLNISGEDFQWSTNANFSLNRNKIISLATDEDDLVNEWFIGQPIDVNFGFVFDGVYQDQAQIDNSAQPDAQLGDAIIRDTNGRDENGNLTGSPDGQINEADRTLIGSLQPDFTWGLANTFSYKGFQLYVFFQGFEGIERPNAIYDDDIRANNTDRNYFKFDYWRPDNPTNFRWANREDANPLQRARIYEDASFIRLKDITFSTDLKKIIPNFDTFSSFSVYATARNLLTITDWNGLDPELQGARAIPLQKEFVFGIRLGL